METLASVKNDQNIAVVQQAFEDFSKGKIEGIIDSCTDDVQWGSYENPGVPYASMYSGKKGVGEFFSNLGGSVDYENFEPQKFYSDKDMVFVVGTHKGKVKTTGKTFDHPFLMQFRVRDGKVSNFFAWIDSADQAQAFSDVTHSSPNIAVVQDEFNRFFQGDIPGIVDQMTEDMKWDASKNPFLPNPRVYSGKKEVFEFFNQINELMEFKSFVPHHFYEKDNTVYVNGHFDIVLKKENKQYSLDWTMRWKFRDGKICAFAEYFAPESN